MCIFQLYQQLCPKDAPSHTFYPKLSYYPTSTCWYSKIPRGHSTLSLTVGHLCKFAGIKRYYTNHSLQAAVTSRLYQYVVDEHLVMERTGHRSLEGVRSYKRTYDEQQCKHLEACLNIEWLQYTGSATHTSQLHSLKLLSATFNNCTVTSTCVPAVPKHVHVQSDVTELQMYHRRGNFRGNLIFVVTHSHENYN